MIRIMIVEDDLLFRRQMRTMLDWNALDMSICAECSDGREALRRITHDVPDLVLTDISMPRMNGIELIAAIKAEYPKVRVIALSSHDDFLFVKDALKLGADDYILKQDIATGMDQFVRVLEEAKERIKPGKAGNADGEHQLILEAIMLRILDGSLTNRADIQRKLNRLMVFFPFERYVTAVIVARDARAVIDIRKGERMPWQPDGMAAHAFRREIISLTEPAAQSRMSFMIDDHTGVCLFNVKGIFSQSRIHNMLRSTFAHAFGNRFAYSIGLSLQVEGVNAFAQSCIQARSAAEDGFLYAEQAIAVYQESDAEKLPEDVAVLLAQEAPLCQEEQPEAWVQKLVQAVYGCRLRMPVFHQFADRLEEILRERAGSRQMADITGYSRFPLHLMAKSHSAQVLAQFIAQCVLQVVVVDEVLAIQTKNNHVKLAIEYINAYYATPCGLQEVARVLNINSNYLSNLFKQETGMRFMEYVNNVRIAHAKRLMIDRDMHIYEVAHACGFQNVEYFSRLYKGKMGYAPTYKR